MAKCQHCRGVQNGTHNFKMGGLRGGEIEFGQMPKTKLETKMPTTSLE